VLARPPRSDPQRRGSENKSERRHQNRTQAQARAFERRFNQVTPFLQFSLAKLDDQNRVLGCQANQDDQSDLRVDVEIVISKP